VGERSQVKTANAGSSPRWIGPFFTQHLPSRYVLEPVHELGFDDYRMDPKP